MNTMTNIQNAPIPEYLVQIVSNSVETLEKYGMEVLFDKYPQWFKNAIDNYKIKIHVIETEIFFKVVNLNGQEVNVFVNDCIGKSDVEGEVYPWFYEGLNERHYLDYGLDNLIITKKGGLKMNISEALKLLQDGKKIYHEITPYVIYQLIDDELKMYRKYDDCEHFVLVDIDNIIKINCKTMLNGWYHRIEPIPINFNVAKEFYKKGKKISRIGKNKCFNKPHLSSFLVTLEDIEANDWEVIE